MPIWERLIHVARANVNALAIRARAAITGEPDERTARSDQPLFALSDEELRAEIDRRARARAGPADALPPSTPNARVPPNETAAGAAPSPRQKQIEQYYANLESSPGADLEAIKKAYRSLMRRYHPDRYLNDPERHRVASELAESLTRAYTELQKYLREGR